MAVNARDEELSASSKLNKMIREKGYTQAEFAEKAGMTLSALRFMLRPDANLQHIRASSLVTVCSLLDVDPRDLIEVPGEESKDEAPSVERVRLVSLYNQLDGRTRAEMIALMESLLKDPSRRQGASKPNKDDAAASES